MNAKPAIITSAPAISPEDSQEIASLFHASERRYLTDRRDLRLEQLPPQFVPRPLMQRININPAR